MKISLISLVRQTIRVFLLLFWIRSSNKNFDQVNQNFTFSVPSTTHTIYNLFEHIVYQPSNHRNVKAQENSNIPSSNGFLNEVKEISLDNYTENRVLRSNRRFTDHGPLFAERESVESLKAVAYNFFVELEHQS